MWAKLEEITVPRQNNSEERRNGKADYVYKIKSFYRHLRCGIVTRAEVHIEIPFKRSHIFESSSNSTRQ